MHFEKGSFIRIFFRSFLILLIPWVIVSAMFAYKIAIQMKQNADESIEAQLYRTQYEIEQQYISRKNSSVLLAAQSELSARKMLLNPINAAKGIELLKTINIYNKDTFDIACYYNTGKIYSTEGATRIEVYLDNTLGCTTESVEHAKKIFESRKSEVAFLNTQSGGEGYLLYHFPNLSSEGESINFIIRISDFLNRFSFLMREYPALITMKLGDQGSMDFYGDLSTGLHVATEEEKSYFSSRVTVASVELPHFGGTLEVRYHANYFYKNVIILSVINVLSVLFLIVISLFVSYLQSRKNYTPINRLIRDIQTLTPPQTEQQMMQNGNELDYIQNMFNRLIRESNVVEKKMVQTKRALKQQTATLLFQGFVHDEGTAEQMLKLCGMERYENFYMLIGFRLEKSKPQVYRKIVDFLQGDLYVETVSGNRQILVVFAEISHKDYVRRTRMQLAKELLKVMYSIDAGNICIGFSQVYQNLSMAPYAYSEVISILEQDEMQQVEFWESKLETSVRSIQLEESVVRDFETALENRDTEKVLNLFHKMQQYIMSGNFSRESSRYLQYCILQPVILKLKESELSGEKKLLDRALKIDPTDLQHFQVELEMLLKDFCHYQENTNDFNRIIQYVNQNYNRVDLSLDEVAEYSGFSKSYLSRLFKLRTGSRYIDYLTQLRMEQARKLLENTELSIKEIVNSVGYYDVPSFRKKFKSIYGINASEYRRKNRKDE